MGGGPDPSYMVLPKLGQKLWFSTGLGCANQKFDWHALILIKSLGFIFLPTYFF